MKRTSGLPVICPRCCVPDRFGVAKHYFGVLKGETVPTERVKLGKSDVCPNCNAPLEPAGR